MNLTAKAVLRRASVLGCIAAMLCTTATPQRHMLSHGMQPGDAILASVQKQPAAADTLRVLAIMVQFQQDDIALTTGNGRFDLSTAPQRIIDAPPHDSAYVADHFVFANNYFRRSSHGRQYVKADVLGKVITLPAQMRSYAPIGSNLPIVTMMEQAWHIADSLYPALAFQQYQLFTIVHAGAGKDIDFRGTYGYDPTPYDIPSLYISASTLNALKGPGYAGIPLPNHPGVTITNSIILPESENRMISSVTGDYLFQLGINGLLVSSIASHIGLPDLFNTKTGGTAIGRFGLMDGQAIFSFSGIFPPQPSAWERQFLGWATPVTVDTGVTMLQLRSGAGAGDTIYKLPVSAKEYFLLENRDRHPGSDGVTLTLRWNGTVRTRYFSRDTTGFNFSVVDSAYGTVLDVDNMDWSLPGADGYRGGALIWHIDETIIDAKLRSNSINADPDHRGVDLEEADGSQDLGQSYGMTDAGSGSEDGWPLDFWYKENESPVFKNAFDEFSHPSSLTNSLAPSHIAVRNFSSRGPVMTVQVERGDRRAAFLRAVKKTALRRTRHEAPQFMDVDGDGTNELVYGSGDSLYVLKQNGSPLFGTTGLFAVKGGAVLPVIGKNLFTGVLPVVTTTLVAGADSLVQFLRPSDGSVVDAANCHSMITTPIVTPDGKTFYAGLKNGALATVTVVSNLPRVSFRQISTRPVVSLSVDSAQGYTAAAEDKLISSRSTGAWSPSSGTVVNIVSWLDRSSGSLNAAVVCDDGSLTIVDCAAMTSKSVLRSGCTGGLALGDLDGDSYPEIIAGSSKGLYAFSRYGVVHENFPLRILDGGTIAADPSVVNGQDGRPVILFGSTAGHLYAASGNGSALSGFPLQTGGVFAAPVVDGNIIACTTADTTVTMWNVAALSSSANAWNGPGANQNHSNLLVYTARAAAPEELLPPASAYNWPNPVYERSTNIRYRLGKPAQVQIRIFTMAGELVGELTGTGNANAENEVVWDVSNVKSGVYFAVVKAASAGDEKSCMIKIAVIK